MMRKFRKILIPVDLGQESSWREALPTAVDQAQHAGGELHIVTIVPDEPPQLAWLPEDYSTKMIAHAESQLAKLVETEVPGQMKAASHVRQGTIYSEIVKLARELDVDLVIMVSHRPELKDFLLGPNAARVVRHAECPVLVLR
jgi:nucleotide-binding universal stress UspA family protein